MNEEVNIKVTQATQQDEINRLKNEIAESAKTIRELSAQLGQAKQSTDIISVIKNIARQECMEMITEEVAETVDTRLQNNLSDYWDISDHEDDIAEVVSNVLDSEDIPSAHDLEYNLDMLNYENEIKAIAREVIEQTEFDVSVK